MKPPRARQQRQHGMRARGRRKRKESGEEKRGRADPPYPNLADNQPTETIKFQSLSHSKHTHHHYSTQYSEDGVTWGQSLYRRCHVPQKMDKGTPEPIVMRGKFEASPLSRLTVTQTSLKGFKEPVEDSAFFRDHTNRWGRNRSIFSGTGRLGTGKYLPGEMERETGWPPSLTKLKKSNTYHKGYFKHPGGHFKRLGEEVARREVVVGTRRRQEWRRPTRWTS